MSKVLRRISSIPSLRVSRRAWQRTNSTNIIMLFSNNAYCAFRNTIFHFKEFRKLRIWNKKIKPITSLTITCFTRCKEDGDFPYVIIVTLIFSKLFGETGLKSVTLRGKFTLLNNTLGTLQSHWTGSMCTHVLPFTFGK